MGVVEAANQRSSASAVGSPYALKRFVDVTVGTLALIVALPLMAVIAGAVLLVTGGPAIFKAPRLGKGGRVFTMYKFRTMVVEAENQLNDLAHLNVARGMIKIPNDPRVTGFGRILRKFSLDELPQLFNVIRGDMSLVGPRPHVPSEVDPSLPENQRRLSVRPGLTGLWQVSARSNPALEARVAYDFEYLERCSPWLDVRILTDTIVQVLRGDGDRITPADAAIIPIPPPIGPELVLPADVTIEAVSS